MVVDQKSFMMEWPSFTASSGSMVLKPCLVNICWNYNCISTRVMQLQFVSQFGGLSARSGLCKDKLSCQVVSLCPGDRNRGILCALRGQVCDSGDMWGLLPSRKEIV